MFLKINMAYYFQVQHMYITLSHNNDLVNNEHYMLCTLIECIIVCKILFKDSVQVKK